MIKVIFAILARFPLPLLHGIGALLGWAVYGLSANYRRKIEQHAAIAFPHDLRARQRAVAGSVAHAGMALMELPFLWGRSTREGAAKVTDITRLGEEARVAGSMYSPAWTAVVSVCQPRLLPGFPVMFRFFLSCESGL